MVVPTRRRPPPHHRTSLPVAAWLAAAVVALAAVVTTSTAPAAQAAAPPLVSAQSGRCLDVNGNNATPGAGIQIWDCNGVAGQGWTLTSPGAAHVRRHPLPRRAQLGHDARHDAHLVELHGRRQPALRLGL